MEQKAELILIRGLPGSGKSTLARQMEGFTHLEADMFFLDKEGKYNYQKEKVSEAHNWCKRELEKELRKGGKVVVSNTFSRLFEMQDYLAIAKKYKCEVKIIEATGNWKNIHDIPENIIERMRDRWEVLK